jgi:hypothetical protein
MRSYSNKKQSDSKPVIRTVILKVSPRLWKGCIYLSALDVTGQLIQFLYDQKEEYQGKYLNYPIFAYKASNKADLQVTLKNKLHYILTSNR